MNARLSAAPRFLALAALLLAGLLPGPAAWAQPRELGPPVLGGGLEGTPQDAPQVEEDEGPVIPIPTPGARPSDAPPTLPDRTGLLLGEIEILDIPLALIPNYRAEMREIVEELSRYARQRNPQFVVVTRPGFDLLTWSRREFDLTEIKRNPAVAPSPDTIVPIGMPLRRYIQATDGFILEGQFCSPLRVPPADLARMMDQGLQALSIEHCPDGQTAMLGLEAAAQAGIVAHVDTEQGDVFAAVPSRRPIPENSGNVQTLAEARNMLVLLDSRRFASKEDYLFNLQRTNYDVLVVDAFYNGNQPLSRDEVHGLKFKEMGARRLVLAQVNVGFARDDRFYWQRDWRIGAPSWIVAFSQDSIGEYVVEFWNPAWKSIVGRYFAGIMDLGFDGVVIDGVDAYRRFEFQTPLDPATGM